MSEAPVFLLSSERSGSNLIRVMMDSHPVFDAPHAPHIIKTFLPLLSNYGNLEDRDRLVRMARDMLTVVQVQLRGWPDLPELDEVVDSVEDESFAGLVRSLYGNVAKKHGKSRSFIKDNGNIPHAAEVALLFPDAKFIFLVRDPRDVALSWKKSPGHPGGVRDASKMWCSEQTMSLDFFVQAQERDIVSLIHYEDLVADPAAALGPAMEMIGERFDESMLAFHKGKEAKISADAAIGWTNLVKPVMGSNTRKFEQELSSGEIRAIEKTAWAPMTQLGYEPSLVTQFASKESDLFGKLFRAARTALTQIKRGSAGIKELRQRADRLSGLRRVMRNAANDHPQWSSPDASKPDTSEQT